MYYEVNKLNILDETFNYDDFNNDILYEIDLNNGNELYFKGLDLYYLGKYEEAYKYLKKASDLNNASATYLLSWCYRTNKGIETDYDIADELLYKAFEMGANDATFAYAKSLTRWFNKKCNYAEALKIYTDLAMNGNLEAYYILGESYLRGNFTVKDYNLAFTWFKRGANLGHSLCMYKLSECYRYEIGVNQDDKEYIKWLKKSAHSGCDLACYELSFSYLYGYGVDIDKELAFHYCLMAANMGNDNAMFKLGNYFYSLGVGVKQDDFLMRKWIWDAAVASNEDARIVCDYPGGSTENILKRYEEYVFLKKSVED